MSGHILIVEPTTSQRIRLRGLLAAAHYDVVPASDAAGAARLVAGEPPALVLVDISGDRAAALAFLSGIRGRAETAALPVIALAAAADAGLRLAALRAGADDILAREVEPGLLLARIRSLLRVRDAAADLRLGDGAARALGMAEAARAFVPAGRIVIVTRRRGALPPPLAGLAHRLPGGPVFLPPEADLAAGEPPADLFVIDHADGGGDGPEAAALFRLIADLRARAATRHAKLLVILPETATAAARMALDLGADDIVPASAGCDEAGFRIRALLRRKCQADRRRDRLESGLAAALTDPLTGLFNRRYAMAEIDILARRQAEGGPPWSMILLDIDHFKRVNDSHGHAAGDIVLREVAALLRGNLRLGDLVARIGGEEFLVLLPDTPADTARAVAERLRRLVERARIDARAGGAAAPLRITLSAGVAAGAAGLPAAGEMPQLFDRADRALYAAKSAGRNRVTIAAGA